MGNSFPGDLYGRLMDEDLGPGYYQVSLNLVVMLLINDWLVMQSCFYIILPLPDERYDLTVKAEMKYAVMRKLNEIDELIHRQQGDE